MKRFSATSVTVIAADAVYAAFSDASLVATLWALLRSIPVGGDFVRTESTTIAGIESFDDGDREQWCVVQDTHRCVEAKRMCTLSV